MTDQTLNHPTMRLPITRLTPDAHLPTRAHPTDAGLDLYALIRATIPSGGRAVIPTGVAVAIPAGYAGFLHPRSGLADMYGVTVANAPGTIDAGYRGEVQVILVNHGRTPFRLIAGDRIAQLIITPIVVPELDVVDALEAGDRGDAGFGSTGR